MLTRNLNRTSFLAFLFTHRRAVFLLRNLYFLHLPINDLVDQFACIFSLIISILYFSIWWLYNIAFFWTSCIWNLVFPIFVSHSLSVFNLMVLSCSILHWNESFSRGAFILVIQRGSCFIIKLVLKLWE